MYFLEQKLSQFQIVIYVMTAQVNCGLKEDYMPNRKIKALILCCMYVFLYIFLSCILVYRWKTKRISKHYRQKFKNVYHSSDSSSPKE